MQVANSNKSSQMWVTLGHSKKKENKSFFRLYELLPYKILKVCATTLHSVL